MVKSRTSAPLRSAEQKHDATKRFWSNCMNMWHVCENTACRRARCCRGNPSACFDENFSRMPEGVRDWFILLGAAQKDEMPFDDAWAELTRCGLVAELANWHDLVHGSEASGAVN